MICCSFIGNTNRVTKKITCGKHLSGDIADMFDNHDLVYTHVKNQKKRPEQIMAITLKQFYGTGYKWEIWNKLLHKPFKAFTIYTLIILAWQHTCLLFGGRFYLA